MMRIIRHFRFVLAALLLAGGGVQGAAVHTEVLLKTCFPNEEQKSSKVVEKCKDEDCGLYDEIWEQKPQLIEKSQQYTFLGGTDIGMLWGAADYRVIGEDRVRFLLYVIPTVTTKTTYYSKEQKWIPTSMVRTAFFSSFGEYQGSSVSVAYRMENNVVRREETVGGEPELQMVDLHCTVRKLKTYDKHTTFFRWVDGPSQGNRCVELLWEKPEEPLPWNTVSSMTMDILVNYYCRDKK